MWHPIFSSSSDAFFRVGYGATSRVDKRVQVDASFSRQSSFASAQTLVIQPLIYVAALVKNVQP
jgi:hypothetical protein